MLLEKDGGYYLYTMGDKFLCDTAVLVNIPIFSSEYSGDGMQLALVEWDTVGLISSTKNRDDIFS